EIHRAVCLNRKPGFQNQREPLALRLTKLLAKYGRDTVRIKGMIDSSIDGAAKLGRTHGPKRIQCLNLLPYARKRVVKKDTAVQRIKRKRRFLKRFRLQAPFGERLKWAGRL